MGEGGNGDGVGSGKKVEMKRKKRWRRRQRCPKALRRAYGKSVRSLLEAILFLLPPPKKSEECRCRGGGCLGCADVPASFILREADDVEYRKLLALGFAVLPEDVTPLSEFLPDNRRTQIQVVRNTIEFLVVSATKKCSNVICVGYEKYTQCSHVVDTLCMLPWSLLLSRIGDSMMFHLLSCASIFLAIARNDYLQVTGTPINEFLWSSMDLHREVSGSQSRIQHQSPVYCPTPHGENKDGNDRFMDIGSVKTSKCQWLTSSIIREHCEVTAGKQRKRHRPFSWQRRKKQKQKSDPCDEHELVTLPIANKDGKTSVGMGLSEFSKVDSYDKRKFSDCFMRFITQEPKGSKLINHRQVFYDSNMQQTVLPSGHILLRLKPNNHSAMDLIDHVFCVSDFNSKAIFPLFSEDGNNSFISSNVSHTILDLFKTMIRNAKRCQFVRLLDRHCPIHPAIPSQNQSHKHALKESAIGFLSTNSEFRIAGSPLVEPSGKEEISSAEAIRFHEEYDMNNSFSKHKDVVSFIWAVCRNVVPSPLLGHPCNWRALRRNIANFVKLRRFEKFYLKHCMHQVRTSGFPFISEFINMCHWNTFRNEESNNESRKDCDLLAMESSLHRRLVELWVFWLFSCLIVPILRANFYITESENGRHGVFYYRKVLWKKIMKKYIDNLQNENFQLLDASICASVSERFHCPKVRFLPKENGVRPLVSYRSSHIPISRSPSCNLGNITIKRAVMSPKAGPHEVKYSSGRNGEFISYNLQATAKHSPFPHPTRNDVRDVYVILKGIKMENPDLLGSSVFDYNDIYRKFYHFIASLRTESLSFPRVFLVACDVSKAFDSVDQSKLLHVMDDILQEREFHLRKYVQVRCSKRSLLVHHEHLLIKSGKCGYSVLASKQSRSSHSILVDQASTRRIGRDELLVFLSNHIRKNIWRLDGKLYLHEIGIPQGSMISSFLCSFYYGHLERNIIFPLLGKCSVPLLSKLHRATKMEEMIGSFNSDKSNADEASSCQGVREANSLGEKIKQLQVNYVQGRLIGDSQYKFAHSPSFLLLRLIDDFLFISSSMEEAVNFFLKMYKGFEEYNCFMNSKKFCANFDLPLNSGTLPKGTYVDDDGVTFIPWSGLLVNCHTLEVQADYTRYWGVHLSSTLTVWRSSKPSYHLKAKLCDYMRPKCHILLYDSNINSPAVVRLNAYQAFLLCAMKFHCYVSSMPSGMLFSPTFFMETIENSISYTYKLIKKRIHCFRSEKGLNPILQLKKKEVKWLGLSAYIRALKKKQSRYKELLVQLRSKLESCSGATISHELRYAVEDSHSSAFWKIKY